MASDRGATIEVYGSAISYFTGKLEGYLRFKGIPYTRIAMTSRFFGRVVPRVTGAAQMPAVRLPDGRWMTDTTRTLAMPSATDSATNSRMTALDRLCACTAEKNCALVAIQLKVPTKL